MGVSARVPNRDPDERLMTGAKGQSPAVAATPPGGWLGSGADEGGGKLP